MNSTETFELNLKRWSLISPKGAEVVSKTVCDRISLCKSDSGALNLKSVVNGQTSYLSSNEDPVNEAKEWFSKLSLNNINVIYIYKVGLGYFYDAAKEWLKKSTNRNLVFFEDDPQVIHTFLSCDRATPLLHDSQVVLHLIDHRSPSLPNIAQYTEIYSSLPYIITSLFQDTPGYQELKFHIDFAVSISKGSTEEYAHHGTGFFRNYFLNFLDLPQASLANQLFGKFKGIPAIICGAGPSLNKNIGLLTSLKDSALIFAGGTALNALNAQNVMPHFGIGIDPNTHQFTRLIMNHGYELPFLYRNRLLHEALELIHGDRLYVTGSSGYGIAKHFEEAMGIFENELEEGFNVLTFSTMIAHAMGCNPIICVGIDLAYSKGASYASGISSHPIHDRSEDFHTKTIHDDLIVRNDIYGNPVDTLWKWVGESSWYSVFAKAHPDITLFNATEGGLGFPGVQNVPLAELAKVMLKKKSDLQLRIQGEIQNGYMSQVTPETVHNLINAIKGSLQTCSNLYRRIIECTLAKALQIDAGVNVDERIEREILEISKQLKKEIAFTAFLKVFDQTFSKIKGVEYQRIAFEEDLFPKKVIEGKNLLLELEKLKYLFQTAQINALHIQKLLNEKKQKTVNEARLLESRELIKSLIDSSKNSTYYFDYKTLKIIDPEIKLNTSEEFIPELNSGIETAYYPDNTLKYKQFYQKGVMHGPAYYYAHDGRVLGQSWYLKGKKQGKSWNYYNDGSLHSLLQFRDGQQEGKQYYFYRSGQLKSKLHYIGGNLDGEVLLYFDSGNLQRRLTFIDGKRDGTEEIWDEAGILRIQANYSANRPIGFARTWHPNGTLASENTYNHEHKRISEKTWNEAGNALPDVKPNEFDFFSDVNKQINSLTSSLGSMLTQFSNIAPTIGESNKNQPAPLFEDDFEKLNQQLEQLRNLEQQITKEEKTEGNDPEEATWKSLGTKKQMTEQINLMEKQMSKAIGDFKQEYKNLLDAINKNPQDFKDKDQG